MAAAGSWPLILIRLAIQVGAAMLLCAGALPVLVPIGRLAAELAASGNIQSVDSLGNEEAIASAILPWLALGCMTTFVAGLIGMIFTYWVRGGTLGELGRGGKFSGPLFRAAGRKFFWRVFWINTAFHCVIMVWGTAAFLAAVAFGAIPAPDLWQTPNTLASFDPARLTVVVVIGLLVFVPFACLFRLAEANAVAGDRSAGEALADVAGIIRRHPFPALGTIALLEAVALVLTGGWLLVNLLLRSAGSGETDASCGLVLLAGLGFAASTVFAAILEVWMSAIFVSLAKLARVPADSAAPIAKNPAAAPLVIPAPAPVIAPEFSILDSDESGQSHEDEIQNEFRDGGRKKSTDEDQGGPA